MEQLSGANVTLVEDRPESTQKIIQISGTPEQAERAQSLLQGFILSSKSLSLSLSLPLYVCSIFKLKLQMTNTLRFISSALEDGP